MSLVVTVRVIGSKEIQAKLRRLGSALNDNRLAMKEIGEQAEFYFANQAFNSRGGVFKQKWRELNPKYAAQKRKIWGNKPILEASGTMRSLFYSEADKNQVIISNSAPQFPYHQSAATRYKLPRRQMIGVNSDIKGIVRDVFQKDINRKIRMA